MDGTRWLDAGEHHAWRSYLAASRLLAAQLERELQRDSQMPHTYYEILVQLSEAPDRSLRMSDLADVSESSRSRLSHAVARWEATPDAMYTRTGWLNIERRMVPLARIQTVDVSRGPIMRHFGLTDVKVTTASSRGDIEIEALDDVNAQALLEELTRAAAAVRGDGT